MTAARNPLIPLGLLLVVVGLGNWYTGWDKVVEHELLLATGVPPPSQRFDEFDRLSERTNASLLQVFRRGGDPAALVHAKLDFYQLVQVGGRMLVLLGLFAAAAGCVHTWYRRRLAERFSRIGS